MKVILQTDDALIAAIKSDDMGRRDGALKQLLLDPVVNGKIRDLLNFFNLKNLDADEILQEGLILLDELIRLGKFRGESAVRTFLISICKNLMRNNLKKVNKVVLKESFDDRDSDDHEEGADGRILIEEKTEAETRRDDILKQLMTQITGGCHETLTLYYFKAMSMAQVAAERGLANAEQAKKATHRCREQLRDLIVKNPQLGQFLKASL
jgi:RNA polymerase sigma factor (sigma-70 family)